MGDTTTAIMEKFTEDLFQWDSEFILPKRNPIGLKRDVQAGFDASSIIDLGNALVSVADTISNFDDRIFQDPVSV